MGFHTCHSIFFCFLMFYIENRYLFRYRFITLGKSVTTGLSFYKFFQCQKIALRALSYRC
ncbi:hypothetical protein SAMN05216357_11221 [Porphyromonadaceae bacterium KH3CP3RA]|nr:hypothetical protein SAMN05216357_11221 [Porphyromonadaceae bacterium KH3CP3RA]